MNYCKCGSMLEFGVCSNRHCQEANCENVSWIINGHEYKFKKPITLEEAKALLLDSELRVKEKFYYNTHIKPWTSQQS